MTSKGRDPFISPEVARPLHGDVAFQAGDAKTPRNADRTADLRISQYDVAAYIERLAGDLRAMSQSVNLDSLAYFLEMTRIEASIQAERLGRAIDGRNDASDF